MSYTEMLSTLEKISIQVNANTNSMDGLPSASLYNKHNATMACYIGGSFPYSCLHSDITYQIPKPKEFTRKLLFLKLAKLYEDYKNKKIYNTDLHKLEDIAKLIDCVIYDAFINYEREKKKINIHDRFKKFSRKKVEKITKIPSTTFERKYLATYTDMINEIHTGLNKIGINARKINRKY